MGMNNGTFRLRKSGKQQRNMKKFRKGCSATVIVAILLLAGKTIAGETESTEIVDFGSCEIESTFTYERETDGNDVTKFTAPQLLVRIGVGEFAEFQIGGNGVTYTNPENEKRSIEGSDTEIGAKVRFRHQENWKPEVGAIVSLSIPTGDRSTTSNGVDPTGVFIFNWGLSSGLELDVNFGFSGPTDGVGSNSRYFEFKPRIALGSPLSNRLAIFIEYFGAIISERKPDAHSFGGGITYRINNDTHFGFSGGGGFSSAATDFFIEYGVSFRFRYWRGA